LIFILIYFELRDTENQQLRKRKLMSIIIHYQECQGFAHRAL